MRSPHLLAAVAAMAAMTLAAPVFAQTGPQLPERLSGRWTFSGPAGIFIDYFTVVFEGSRAPGTVPGRLTWRGVNCGSKDEPIQASWDGTELKFEAVLKPEVNTQRLNGKCASEPTRWVLKRKPDQSFEGEGRTGSVMVTVTATP
jgi:hypothetical protein